MPAACGTRQSSSQRAWRHQPRQEMAGGKRAKSACPTAWYGGETFADQTHWKSLPVEDFITPRLAELRVQATKESFCRWPRSPDHLCRKTAETPVSQNATGSNDGRLISRQTDQAAVRSHDSAVARGDSVVLELNSVGFASGSFAHHVSADLQPDSAAELKIIAALFPASGRCAVKEAVLTRKGG